MFATKRLLRPARLLSCAINAKPFSTAESSSLKSAFMRSVKGDKGSKEEAKEPKEVHVERESVKVEEKKTFVSPPVAHIPIASTPPPAPFQKPAPSFSRRPPSADANIQEFLPRICVIGVGGAGCNAVNNMIARGLQGVDFICANTDAQHLSTCLAEKKIQIGKATTSGLGCGANPDVGRAAAEESKEELSKLIGTIDICICSYSQYIIS